MKHPTYKFTYTIDNRIKSVRMVEEEPASDRGSWLVLTAGILACLIWWFQW